jgi:putative oxidoreductase
MNKILNHAIWNTHALLLARIVFGGYFVYSGITKVTGGIDGTAGYITSAGLPAAMALAWVAVLIEVGCGAMIVLGKYFKEATLVLAAFIFIISFIFHGPNSWSPENMQQIMFFKNMCMVAGLLFMAAHGAGNTWTIDKKK